MSQETIGELGCGIGGWPAALIAAEVVFVLHSCRHGRDGRCLLVGGGVSRFVESMTDEFSTDGWTSSNAMEASKSEDLEETSSPPGRVGSKKDAV